MNQSSNECALRFIEDHERLRGLVKKLFEGVALHRSHQEKESAVDLDLWDLFAAVIPDDITDLRIRKILIQPIRTNSSHD